MKIIKHASIKVSNWSGGTTSELYIYPENSNYKDLDFKFRLSKATIEVEQSIFTPLPNVKRKLMLLDGELELIHKHQHSKKLKPLEFDSFSGSWNTKSIGKATDFNLMMLGNTEGDFKVFSTQKPRSIIFNQSSGVSVFYVAKGSINLLNSEVNSGELIIFDEPTNQPIQINFSENSDIISIKITL